MKIKPIAERRVYWGWVVVVSSSFLIFVVAGTSFYGNAMYLVPLQKAFNTSRGTISRAFAIISLLTGLLMPIVGGFTDRWGPRRALLIGFSGLSLTFFLYSRMTSPWHLYVLVVLQGLVVPFAGGLANQALVSRWFVSRKGRAMGIVGAGIGLGGLILPWIVGLLIESRGTKSAYLFSGSLIAIFCVPILIFLVRDNPAKLGLPVDGFAGVARKPDRERKRGIYFKHAIRLFSFWAILVSASLSQGTVGLINLHLPAMLQDAGLPLSTAGIFLGLVLGISVAGRLLIGELSDRFKPRYLFGIACLGTGICALLLLEPENPVVRAVFVVVYGTFQGAVATVIPLVVHSLFGGRAFGRIYGVVLMSTAATVALGNYLGGVIFDTFGNYTAAIVLASAISIVAAIISFSGRRLHENEF